MIYLSVTLIPSNYFCSMSNGIGYECMNVMRKELLFNANGFPMIKTTMFERGHDRYVFPSQCEHVFYSNVSGERDWSFVVRYDPRGGPIKYTHLQEEDDIEDQEDDSIEYQTESEDHGGSTDEEEKKIMI